MCDEPHFLARKIQDYQRRSARGYVCPICTEYFQHESKIWAHAQEAHAQALGISDATEAGMIRNKFRDEAMERAHQNPRRGHRAADSAAAKQPSNDNDSMKPMGDEGRSPVPLRPASAPGPTTDTEKHINDIKDLQLTQDQTTYVSPPGQSMTQSSINPLKRGADTPGSLAETTDQGTASNRRTKALSGGPFINKDKDPDFHRDLVHPEEINIPRNPHVGTKRLFDPNTDQVPSVPGMRNHKQDAVVTPRRVYDAKAHLFRSIKAPSGEFQRNRIDFSFNDWDPKTFEKSSTQPVAPPNGTDSGAFSADSDAEPEPEILLQPETRPISHDQLVVEVKGIYAGLVMVEAKCIDVDEKQSMEAQERGSSRQTKLSNEQWQALFTLHKTLLHEHHDFFLASQHPSASPGLSKLAAKYSMPARMWRHGIHAFLEVLRHRLPESLDHMLAFIYIAYSMMALLYETVSTFEDTWIECLGDLARYRMAIEEEDPRDRDVWSGVARFWYSKAADKTPNVGRLYHHLAILARPYTLQQLSHYTKSLTCVTPFESAKASIMTLFTPILNGKETAYHRSSSFETVFIKAHGILFCRRSSDEFDACLQLIKENLLDNFIGRITAKFKEQGVFVAIACIAALFEYGFLTESGSHKSIFRLAFEEVKANQIDKLKTASQRLNDEAFDVNDHAGRVASSSPLQRLTSSDLQSSRILISQAGNLAFSCLSIALRRLGDKNVLPLVHVYFVFLWSLAAVDEAMIYVEQDIPWTEICSFLNTLAKPNILTSRVQESIFPKPAEGIGRPLPEDFIIRGQMYSQWYFPETWFTDAMVDDEERVLELPSMAETRMERILWLGFRLSSFDRWIRFDHDSQIFLATPYARELETSRHHGGFTPSNLQNSKDEDTVMPDIHVSEDSSDKASIGSPLIPDPPVDTPTSSPIKNTRSSMKEHPLHTPTSSPIADNRSPKPDIDVAMQGVEAVKGAQIDLQNVSVNSDKVPHRVETSNDKNIAKKVTERVYASDPWKLETMKNFDNPSNKKSSTA